MGDTMPPVPIPISRPESLGPPTFQERLGVFLALLQRRGWILLLLTISGSVSSYFLFRPPPPIWSSTTRIHLIEKGDPGGAPIDLEAEAALLRSQQVNDLARARLASKSPGIPSESLKYTVHPSPDHPGSLELRSEAPDGHLAEAHLERILEEYKLLKIQLAQGDLNPTVESARTRIKDLQSDLGTIRSEIDAKSKDLPFDQLEKDLREANLQLKRERKRLDTVQAQIKKSRNHSDSNISLIDSTVQSHLLRKLQPRSTLDIRGNRNLPRDELAAQEKEVALLGQILKPDAPELKAAREKLELARASLEKAESDAASVDPIQDPLYQEELAIQKKIMDWQTRVTRIQGQANGMRTLLNQLRIKEADLKQAQAKFLELGGKTIPEQWFTIEDHQPPFIIHHPRFRWKEISLCTLLGALLGSLGMATLERVDDRIHTARQLYRKTRHTVLGEIPVIPGRDENAGPLLLSQLPPHSPFAEAFRTVVTRVLDVQNGSVRRSILVTSSIPSDGKSTNSVNLSIALSEKGKTLLIDADLRRMNLHKYFGLENGKGLLEILSHEETLQQTVLATPIPNLFFLPAGHIPEKATEMFLANGFKPLLAEGLATYDYVVVDSAPVMVADDTLSLAPQTDAVIFVVRAHQTPYRFVRKSLRYLEKRNAPVAGVIFNGIHIH